ncbi:31155_t:CDS:2 [Racocetra persica]|uniref:31155_t:CDS:1 n=1 Tax=Racocetra persica TaxID=160502 RepID=A0ACA9MNJ7_9GLOM|nr:31155_t:CDS:2 [Racocetra persica]
MSKVSRKDGKKPYYYSNSLPDHIRIREFQQKDIDEIQRIYANSMMDTISYETRHAIHTDLSKISEKYGSGTVQQQLTKSDKYHSQEDLVDQPHNDRIARFWVAVDKEAGNKVVGFLEIVDNEDDDPLRKKYIMEPYAPHIKHLCVATNYKRKGIATALLKHAIKFIHKKNAKSLGVLTSAWQGPAMEIFYRFGFIEVKRRTMTYGFVECIKLSLDVEQWIRCRKARKHSSSISSISDA